MSLSPSFRVTLISTGGTIEKTYNERDGALSNRMTVLDAMLAQLALPALEIQRVALMNKDSLQMGPADHLRIVAAVEEAMAGCDGVLVVHGTDRLTVTGERLHAAIPQPAVPVVLTGAMRPYELRRTDALQNLTESLLALRLLEPGIWCVMHGRALRFPGVRKDRERGTFVPSHD